MHTFKVQRYTIVPPGRDNSGRFAPAGEPVTIQASLHGIDDKTGELLLQNLSGHVTRVPRTKVLAVR